MYPLGVWLLKLASKLVLACWYQSLPACSGWGTYLLVDSYCVSCEEWLGTWSLSTQKMAAGPTWPWTCLISCEVSHYRRGLCSPYLGHDSCLTWWETLGGGCTCWDLWVKWCGSWLLGGPLPPWTSLVLLAAGLLAISSLPQVSLAAFLRTTL